MEKKSSGFTLIEIIMVFVLMALLSTLAFSSSYSSNEQSDLRTASLQLLANMRSASLGSMNSDDVYMVRFFPDSSPPRYELHRKRGTVEEMVDFPGGEGAVYLPKGTKITTSLGDYNFSFDRYGRVCDEFPDDTFNHEDVKMMMHYITPVTITIGLNRLTQKIWMDHRTGYIKLQ